MRKILLKLYHIFNYLLFDPIGKFRQYKALPLFIANYFRFRKRWAVAPGLPLRMFDFYVTTADKFQSAGTAKGHYFFQDIWAATKIYQKSVRVHTDIGSRIDGFIAHLLPFCRVQYVDLRKMDNRVDNLEFLQGSILQLPFEDNSIDSLSCLHVIEHIGLGRYGDDIDPAGHEKAARELVRVLKPGGTMYIGTPVGRERICFDAHRIFDPKTVVGIFAGLALVEFSLIDDKGDRLIRGADMGVAAGCGYGCGLFEFKKNG
jgi:SAM-dependent methyltransferase